MVQIASRQPGGNFSAPGAVSDGGEVIQAPSIDVAPNGAATVLWRVSGLSETFLQTVSRPPGGAFEPAVNVNSGKDDPLFGGYPADGAGGSVVVWSGENGADQIVRAAVRGPGAGTYTTPVAISQSSPDFFHPDISMDADGNATVVWVRSNGSQSIVQQVGYDARAPQLSGVSIPSSGKVGDPLQFSASAFDAWPIGPPSFAFGDGASARGNSVSHAYSAPGSYTVRAMATDGAGRTASTATLLVKARNFFKVGKLKTNPKKGTGTLTITFPEPGAIVVSGKGVRKVTVRAAKGGAAKVQIKPVAKGRRRLAVEEGQVKAQLKVEYSPVGGDINTQRHVVTLAKRVR